MQLPLIPKGKPRSLASMLHDASVPLEARLETVRQLALSADDTTAPILAQLLESAAAARGEDVFREKNRELAQLIHSLQEGPLRSALFDRMLDDPGLGRRAQVILPDGTLASPLVPDAALAEKMRCGDNLWLDSKGTAVLHHAAVASVVGDEARLERVLASGYLEVSVGELGRSVYRPSARLREQLASGEARLGSTLIVCPRRMIAFLALPAADGPSHQRFLCREPVPEVDVERDLGAPPAFIGQIVNHLRRELAAPGVATRYRLRRSKLNLLSGVPGSGKTFAIQALWNAIYRVMSEVTGVPVAALPPRVMRLRASEVLSKWLGQSDKQIARFFEEVDQLAAETFQAPDGRIWPLPLLVIAEEVDALARTRGQDGIHDRILATLLERLDPGRPVFRDRLVFIVATTNTSQLIDVAMIRRIGGRIERFGHMQRFSFRSVLAKQLRDLPFRRGEHGSAEEARSQAISDVTAWLFGPNAASTRQVEITFAGQANPVTRHSRDFLTAGLIDRAVQQACEEAANAEHAGTDEPGLSAAILTRAIEQQVRQIVDLLTPQNCGQYLSLPDGEHAARLRRVERPAATPFELERAS